MSITSKAIERRYSLQIGDGVVLGRLLRPVADPTRFREVCRWDRACPSRSWPVNAVLSSSATGAGTWLSSRDPRTGVAWVFATRPAGCTAFRRCTAECACTSTASKIATSLPCHRSRSTRDTSRAICSTASSARTKPDSTRSRSCSRANAPDPAGCLQAIVLLEPAGHRRIRSGRGFHGRLPPHSRLGARFTHAWASVVDTIVHQLSGGLDSSIVLAALKSALPAPRGSAQLLLARRQLGRTAVRGVRRGDLGCEIVTHRRSAAVEISPILRTPRTPWPCSSFTTIADGEERRRLYADTRADAVSYGFGGDVLFHRLNDVSVVVDFVYRHGIDRRLPRIALDAAQLERTSLSNVASEALAYGLFKRRYRLNAARGDDYRYSADRDLKTSVQADLAYVHPLFREPRDVPPGKLVHARNIVWTCCHRYDPFERSDDPAFLAPLCSQPFLELSLRIPVYVLTKGARIAPWREPLSAKPARGRDPPQGERIVSERKKDLVRDNLPLLRELMLDGVLVREGLLKRAQMEQALSDNAIGLTRTRQRVTSLRCDGGVGAELVLARRASRCLTRRPRERVSLRQRSCSIRPIRCKVTLQRPRAQRWIPRPGSGAASSTGAASSSYGLAAHALATNATCSRTAAESSSELCSRGKEARASPPAAARSSSAAGADTLHFSSIRRRMRSAFSETPRAACTVSRRASATCASTSRRCAIAQRCTCAAMPSNWPLIALTLLGPLNETRQTGPAA